LSIKKGKELENILGSKEELTKEDKRLLLSFIPIDDIAATEKMKNPFKGMGKPTREWNDEMVDALNKVFDDGAKNWSETKK